MQRSTTGRDSVAIHPVEREDAAALAALRAMVGSAKGMLRGIEARKPFDALMESVLSRVSEHWQAILGPILVLIVLFSKTGLLGLLAFPGRLRWPNRS